MKERNGSCKSECGLRASYRAGSCSGMDGLGNYCKHIKWDNEKAPCTHNWQKTMDLRYGEYCVRIYDDLGNVIGWREKAYAPLEQRQVCSCGAERWEEV